MKAGKHPEKSLSAAFVRHAKEPGRFSDGQGLYLLVDQSGAKRWLQRIVVRGKRRDLGLGSASLVSLSDARQKAEQNRKLARSGGDPLAAKRKVEAIPNFSEAVAQYHASKSKEFRSEKHAKQWRSALDAHVAPAIGRVPVDQIGLSEVLLVLKPIWLEKTETAKRIRQRIEAVLAWATVQGFRSGDNPARWKGNLESVLPKPGMVAKADNHPALSLADLPKWWSDLRQREGMATRALEFLALTAARSGEVRGAVWSEIDLGAGLWVIPASRMKSGREHRVPLTEQAIQVLRMLPRFEGSDYVFPAARGGQLSDMSLSATMRRIQEAKVRLGEEGYVDKRTGRPAVPHGLRSTFRDWTAERGYDRDMAEMALAHSVGSTVERAYRRSDMLERRRAMMEAWTQYLNGKSTGQVVQLRSL